MVNHCQTFLWRGEGLAENVDGDFLCECQLFWSSTNILGRPSCVPSKAHLIYGTVGLVSSTLGICHAAYQLKRQVEFHKHQPVASASPSEDTRRELHIISTAHCCIALAYFTLVLLLPQEKLWVSITLLAGVSQVTASIGGILTVRMWIYTNDPRLTRETPEIMEISDVLEQPAGKYGTYGMVSIAGVVGTILGATNHTRAAVKVAAVGMIVLSVGCNMVIWKCGSVLVATIDRSMGNTSAANQTSPSSFASNLRSGARRNGAGGDRTMLAARTKIKTCMKVCLMTANNGVLLLTFAVASPYGTAAPLFFFGVQLGIGPLLWFIFNIQLHAGRSKARTSPGPLAVASPGSAGYSRPSTITNTTSRKSRVVLPNETPT